MKFAELIPLTAAAVNLLISCVVLSRSKQRTTNRVYLLWGLGITAWNVGTYFMFRVKTEPEALFWARFLQFGVIALPVSLFHLALLTANCPNRFLIRTAYIAGAVLACANFTPLFVAGVKNVGYAWYSIGGPAFWVFTVLYLILTSSTCVILYRRTLQPASLARTRARSLLWAAAILITFGTNDILPILGIYYYPFSSVPIFPVGSLAAILFGLLVAYSVLQHQLLDVHIALGRAAAHLVRFAFLFAIGLGLQLLLTVFARDRMNAFTFVSSICVLLVSTFVASMLFPRLLGNAAEGFERRLLGDCFEYQDQVRNFIERMSWYSDLHQLLDDVHELCVRTFHMVSYEIILRDETRHVFEVVRSYPEGRVRQLPDLKATSPVFQHFVWQKGEYLSLKTHVLRAGESLVEKSAREELSQFHATLCFPFRTENEPFGLLVVGDKVSTEPYTATDVNLLVALVKNMSLMINQIRLKTLILQGEELDLLGRMSRGVAHDLNNLLTPISTLLQLSSEGVPHEAMEELLPVALRNVKAMRAYIRESLFFSENLRPDFQLGRLDMLVAHAAEVARNSRQKVVDIVTETPGEILVEMDEVLIQRMMANLISNAIDASATDARIRVELVRLIKTEASRDWLRVRIIDKGEGIRKEDLNRVFTPYFTTKNRGDETRGFGLGLAICRKIVNLHGGNLSIASQLKRGTTVQVDLPSRQIKQAASPVAA